MVVHKPREMTHVLSHLPILGIIQNMDLHRAFVMYLYYYPYSLVPMTLEWRTPAWWKYVNQSMKY